MLTSNKLLSQQQVNELPDGTRVVITWTGGNGPHIYTTRNWYGWSITEFGGTVIDRVGEYPLTQVRLYEPDRRDSFSGIAK
jgi:hypothetical protein